MGVILALEDLVVFLFGVFGVGLRDVRCVNPLWGGDLRSYGLVFFAMMVLMMMTMPLHLDLNAAAL